MIVEGWQIYSDLRPTIIVEEIYVHLSEGLGIEEQEDEVEKSSFR